MEKSEIKEKQRIVEDYIKRQNDAKLDSKDLGFDLRGYQKYLNENNIHGFNVTEDIMNRFIKK